MSDEPGLRARHERFLISRLAAGAVMMAALPPYLVCRGVPSGIEAIAIACLFLPVLAAIVLARTGLLWVAHALSSVGLTGIVVCLATVTGGSGSSAAIWLTAIPLEAAISGSKRATLAAALAAGLGALALALAGPLSPSVPDLGWLGALAMPLFALTGIAYVGALALAHLRREGAWRARMHESEANDRLLLTAIDDLVTWHDGNGRVLEASASAARFLGAEPSRLHGQGLLDRVLIGDRPALLHALSEVAATGRPATVPFRLHLDTARPDGTRTVFAEMRAHPMASGRGAAVVAVTRDVSEHRRHAEELDRAREQAEQADLAKGRFLASVGHELRTPLNAIIGFSDILSGEGAVALPPERAREYAGLIAASGRDLLDVVNMLLDMSRIQSGHFDFAPETVDMRALLKGCCDLMRLKADAAGVALVCAPVPADCRIVADARACRQIVINLISNAVKFSKRGGRVAVGVRCGGGYLDIVVEDDGVGIAEGDLPRIGDAFFQAGGGYGRSHEGTGLGLSVVRGLVGLHGGSIALDSAPGQGTTIVVTLPADCGHVRNRALAAPIRVSASGRSQVTEVAPVASILAPMPAPMSARLPAGLFDASPVPAANPAGRLLRAG